MQPKPTLEKYGPRRLTLELTNICNLHCSYCSRDEDALYATSASFFPVDLLKHLLTDARQVAGIERVSFTGGEPTLHPRFGNVLDIVAANNLKASFVTNGWHFARVWPLVLTYRETLTHVAFSFDGITREVHDRWRGAGSFDRLIAALARCHAAGIPFTIKMVIRRDLTHILEQVAMFAARLGAAGLNLVHLMPTSNEFDSKSLSLEERRAAEEEIAVLSSILKMKVALDVGYYNIDAAPPCSPLAGTSFNIDYRGRLSLCCNLSGFRGGVKDTDVVADLNVEPFATAFERLQLLAASQVERRTEVLKKFEAAAARPDVYVGSPCLFCLQTFAKVPWHSATSQTIGNRALPVVNTR
ncbi:MAG: radical SAM protein [Pyrinomonadaceae bacterium]